MEENVRRGQEKQVAAHAKKITKKHRNVQYNAGDEVLLFNVRKRGRKGGRLEPDFCGPYTIEDISGKCVTLKADGKTLRTKYSVDHIKPYRRPEGEDLVRAESHVDAPRPSVINFAKKVEPHKSSSPVKLQAETPHSTQDEGGLLRNICS